MSLERHEVEALESLASQINLLGEVSVDDPDLDEIRDILDDLELEGYIATDEAGELWYITDRGEEVLNGG